MSGSSHHEELATACPILCFINPKSGSQYGVKLLEQLDKVLGAQQVGLTCCSAHLQAHTEQAPPCAKAVAARQVPGVQQVYSGSYGIHVPAHGDQSSCQTQLLEFEGIQGTFT